MMNYSRAQGLSAHMDSLHASARDQDNLFVVISARKLNPHLRIASKAVEDNSPGKLITAGADEVVLPDHIGGLRLASGILQPQLVGFLENITQNQDGGTVY